MISVQSGSKRPRARRTEGELRLRRSLADAAVGVAPGEVGVSAEVARTERFRCVVYLCGAPSMDITGPREECTKHAEAFGWEITGVIEERVGLLPPQGRDGLRQAVERIGPVLPKLPRSDK